MNRRASAYQCDVSGVIVTGQRDFSDELVRVGLKSTKQRSAILDILEQSDQPLAAEQVFLELKNRGVSANLSTVYRTLEVLSDRNLAVKLNISGDSRALFEYNRKIHRHYLICLGCKKIMAIHRCPLKDYEKALEEETNYSISGHKLDVYGYCPECQSRSRQQP